MQTIFKKMAMEMEYSHMSRVGVYTDDDQIPIRK